MNFEQLKNLGLTEEQAKKVSDEFKGYIPKSRFDEVNEAKKRAEALVSERDAQLAELKKSSGDIDSLKSEITRLQEENKAAQEKYQSDMTAFKLNSAIEKALLENGAKNVKAVKALLDNDKIKLDGDTVLGLTEQIKALKSDDGSKFMFAETSVQAAPAGMKPANNGNNATPNTKADEYKARLDEARKNNNMPEAIRIKQEAIADGITLM